MLTMKADAGTKARAERAYAVLVPLWPDAKPLLDYRNCFELLCAVMLSAQCTDEQVNRVTPALFDRWPTSAALAKAQAAEVEAYIHSVGFFHTKARHLVATARLLVEKHGGALPETMEAMLELPGVGRKTANLVLSACTGAPGIIVDTHVLRVALRLGLEKKPDPAAVEKRIAALLPEEGWTAFSHALNRHGKYLCTARKPVCTGEEGPAACPLGAFCPRIGLKRG